MYVCMCVGNKCRDYISARLWHKNLNSTKSSQNSDRGREKEKEREREKERKKEIERKRERERKKERPRDIPSCTRTCYARRRSVVYDDI